MSAYVLKEGRFEMQPQIVLGLFAHFLKSKPVLKIKSVTSHPWTNLVLVETAYFGRDDVVEEPVDRLVGVEHDEELHQPWQLDALEHFADEAELAELDDEPRLVVGYFVVGEFQHDAEEAWLSQDVVLQLSVENT